MPEIFSLVQWIRIDRLYYLFKHFHCTELAFDKTKYILTNIAFISGATNSLHLAFAIVSSSAEVLSIS